MASRPIRNYEDLYLFLSILKEKHSLYGDFATVQFQWGLRFQTTQSLTVGDVRKCLRNGSVLLVENKTGKKRACGLNDKVKEVFLKYISDEREDLEVLWGRTIVRETYNLKLKEIGLMLGWDVAELSSHSLRKSFAYHLRTKFNVPVEKISEQMNHASVRTTLIYAGLAEDEKVAITQLGL